MLSSNFVIQSSSSVILSSSSVAPLASSAFGWTPQLSSFLLYSSFSILFFTEAARVTATNACSVVCVCSNSVSSGMSVPRSTDMGSDTAASTTIDLPSTSSEILASGYRTVSPCAQRIATASPSCAFSLGTNFRCTRVLEHPVSNR